jgi:hypothetical protein
VSQSATYIGQQALKDRLSRQAGGETHDRRAAPAAAHRTAGHPLGPAPVPSISGPISKSSVQPDCMPRIVSARQAAGSPPRLAVGWRPDASRSESMKMADLTPDSQS